MDSTRFRSILRDQDEKAERHSKKTSFLAPESPKRVRPNYEPPKLTSTSPPSLSQVIATNKSLIRPGFLNFLQHDLESEFNKHFARFNVQRWIRIATILFTILTTLYIYHMVQNTIDSKDWGNGNILRQEMEKDEKLKMFNGTLFGYHMYFIIYNNSYECDEDIICGEYFIIYDIIFWCFSCLFPYIAAMVAATYFTASHFSEHFNIISTVLIFLNILLGIGVRYYIISSYTQFVQPTLLMNFFIALAFYGLRVRFIFTLISTSIISFVWIVINLPWIFINLTYASTGRSFCIGSICMILTGLFSSFAAYETEYFYRMQFLMSKEMKKNNAKLTNQLKALAKSYNKQAGSLDSPLERSVMVIRSVMADPILSSQHLMALGQVLALLSSSNLLTPDLEGNFEEGLDNQQQVYFYKC